VDLQVDLNCDLGESFGAWRMGADAEVLPHVTSVNVACGFHAGDPGVMRRTVELALAHGVALGAHPSLPDLAGFGRRQMDVTTDEAYEMVVYQVGALAAFAAAAGTRLQHVTPHGALYNMAAARADLADAVARAVRAVDAGLALYGLAGSHLVAAAERVGLRAISEVFADRAYTRSGALVPRTRPDAMIHDPTEAARRVVRMVRDRVVQSVDGTDVPLRAESVCVHGDGADAAGIARRLRETLEVQGIAVRAPGRSTA
jgi:UPF0271 protein